MKHLIDCKRFSCGDHDLTFCVLLLEENDHNMMQIWGYTSLCSCVTISCLSLNKSGIVQLFKLNKLGREKKTDKNREEASFFLCRTLGISFILFHVLFAQEGCASNIRRRLLQRHTPSLNQPKLLPSAT